MYQARETNAMTPSQGKEAISQKTPIFVGLGVILWLAFLIFMRLLGPDVFSTGNPALLVMFIAAFPIIFATIAVLSAVLRIPMNRMLVPVVIIDLTALFLDGLAIGFTDFYGPTADQVAASAAYLMWGVAASLVITLWFSARPQKQP